MRGVATKRAPATFDLDYIPPRPVANANVKRANTTRQGICRLDGDQLTVVYSLAGRERPASPNGELEVGQYRWVLKRQRR